VCLNNVAILTSKTNRAATATSEQQLILGPETIF
jgi:hypothetical protein